MPVMLAIIILFTSIGLVQALRLPAVYEAEARLLVESPQISDDLVDVTVTTSADEEITIIRERLLTRRNLLEIANQFDVFEDYSELPPDRYRRADAAQYAHHQHGRAQPGHHHHRWPSRRGQRPDRRRCGQRIRHPDHRRQCRVAHRRAEGTFDFFEQEVQRLSSELDARSARISQFQAENADALPADQQFRLNRQAVLQERLSSAQRELSSLIDQRSRIIAIYEATGQISNADNVLTDDQRQLRDLERELAQLLSIYSEDAPQVVTLRRRIDTLRTQVADSTDPSAPETSGQAVLNLQLGQIDVQVETLESVIEEARAELVRLEDAISRTPLNAITLQSLERDYENIRGQYDSSVARLAQASTGERIELTSRGQRISLIEAASVPQNPARPNRKLIAAAAGVAGVGLAVGLFVLLEILNHTVRRPTEIQRGLGIEPLVTIPYIDTRRERTRRLALRAAALMLVMIGLPAALWAIDTYYIPLDQLASEVLSRFGLA
jgi:uncharacterized protein involved in exopolysaccharide biosynthesis